MNTRIHDSLSVIVPNGAALAIIHSIDARLVVDLAVGIVAIGYTLWRWRKDAKGDK
jgi:hypothetical protein